MPLQNRVSLFGEIVAISQRGMFTGNRGIIHDPATRTLPTKRWATKSWLICTCNYMGRRRAVMAGRSWTELFFLDEAVGLAAGHRPCFLIGDTGHELEAELAGRFPRSTILANEIAIRDDLAKVLRFMENPTQRLDLELDIRGTSFQRRVWEKLCAPPAGKTVSYMDLAKSVGPLEQGDAVVLAVANRPVTGTRGTYRVNLRHGFSKVRTGRLRALSLVFHDAIA